MRGERLFRILGLVDAALIEEAGTASSAAAFKRPDGPAPFFGRGRLFECAVRLELRLAGHRRVFRHGRLRPSEAVRRRRQRRH